MFRFLMIFALICLVAAAGTSAADVAKPGKAPKIGYKGKLTSFNPDLNTIRVSKGSKTITFAVDKDAAIVVDQVRSKLTISDVPLDTYVSLILNADKSTVTELRAEGPGIRCTIQAIDLDKRTLRVKTSKTEAIYPFIENVAINTGKLDDLKPGMVVTVKLTHDKSKVFAVKIDKK